MSLTETHFFLYKKLSLTASIEDEASGVTDPVIRMILRAASMEREENWSGAEGWYAKAAEAAGKRWVQFFFFFFFFFSLPLYTCQRNLLTHWEYITGLMRLQWAVRKVPTGRLSLTPW